MSAQNQLFGRPVSRWLAFWGFWTLTALSFATNFYFSARHAGFPVSWWRAVTSSLADWYLFGALSVPMVVVARRFPLQKVEWRRRVLGHLAASMVFSLLYVLLRSAVAAGEAWLVGSREGFPQLFGPFFSKTFHLNIWIYWVILVVSQAAGYYQALHERELKTSELEARLAQARLQALQMQMNPHFLFNTLHTISALVHKDVEAADRMIAKLSSLLRLALDNTDEHEVPLHREIEFLKRYLEIEQTRFRERLTVSMDFPSDLTDLMVPNLVLQPLVENAIRHGIEPHARAGKVDLSGRLEGGRLVLEVRDNGNGLPGGKLRREGIGTSNTRIRLQQLYGDAQKLEFESPPGAGLTVRVTMPIRVFQAS